MWLPPPPQPHPAGKGWCAAALLHLDADSPTSSGDDLTLLCALLFWSNIPQYSRRHGGEVMPGGVQASAQDARYIALTSHVSGKFKWGTGECVFFGLPHNDNWYMRNRVIHIALFCSRFNKRASFLKKISGLDVAEEGDGKRRGVLWHINGWYRQYILTRLGDVENSWILQVQSLQMSQWHPGDIIDDGGFLVHGLFKALYLS